MGNSNLHDPSLGTAGGTPVFAPPAKPTKSGPQTKEVLEHLQQIQQRKKSGSVLNNPAFLGAAMKAIYDSSEVSVIRGDQTMVVTQPKDDEPTTEIKTERRASTTKEQPVQIDQSTPLSSDPDRYRRSNPFSSRPPFEQINPASTPELAQPEANIAGESSVPPRRISRSYSSAEITFWVLLVLVILGLAFWISL